MKIRIVFTHGDEPRFVEIENNEGKSINIKDYGGEWLTEGEFLELELNIATPLDPATVLCAITAEEASLILQNRAIRARGAMSDQPLLPFTDEAAALHDPDRIPDGVYYNVNHDNFYNFDRHGMGKEFFQQWHDRREEFPQRHPDDVPPQKQTINQEEVK